MYIVGITKNFDESGKTKFYWGRSGYFHSGPNRHDGSMYFTVHVGQFLVNVTESDMYVLRGIESDRERLEYLDLTDRDPNTIVVEEEYW